MKLKTLSLFTSILFLASIFVYTNENKRGSDLLAGSDYIKGLDINKIKKISLSFNDNKKIILTRDSDRFLLETHKSYPASIDKVNDLIYKIASIQVKEKVLSGPDEEDLENYELNEKKRKYLVELFDNEGRKTVSFSVGKSHKGKGNYLLKDGKKDVYLSKNNLWLNSSYRDFINTVLLEVKKSDIEKVSLVSDKNLNIIHKDKAFVIENHTDKKYKNEKVEEYINNFSSVRFEEYYPLRDPKVQGSNFDKDIKISLKNKLTYKLSLAKDKSDHFMKLTALLEEVPNQFVVKKDDGKEELQKIEDVIKAQGDAQKINLEKGTWVYEIDKSTYEKLSKDSTFFL